MIAVPAGDKTALVGQYVGDKVGLDFDPGMYTAMAVLDDEKNFVAGVIFSEYRGHDIQLSTATESPMAWRDSVLRAIFDYVFNQLECVRCTAVTKKNNRKARSFLEGLGFQLEGSLRLGYDGSKDALIYGLLASECRYLATHAETDSGEENAQDAEGTGRGPDGSDPDTDEPGHGDSERQPKPDQPIHPGRLTRVPADWY